MILHKFWSAFVAQINKVANLFWEADPIAQMRYEYDQAVNQLKEGRTGLEQYRGLVERVTRQVSANRSHVQKLEAETKAYLKVGDRATAAKFALELQKAKQELAGNEQQLAMHETAYGNNLTDEAVVANTFQPPFGAFVVGTLRPPRLYGVRIGARF